MADPVSVAAGVISLLNVATKTSEELLRLQKFQVWQQTWWPERKDVDVSAEALWGAQGWQNVRRMLEVISNTSTVIRGLLQEMKKLEEDKPRSRWQRAYKVIRAKQGPSPKLQDLQSHSTTLSRTVDELWIYSETVFDSLHGILSLESRIPERDLLLRTALHSRPGSLELYNVCSKSTTDCSLEMELLDSGVKDHQLHSRSSETSLPIFYHLCAQSRQTPMKLDKLVVESVPAPSALNPGSEEVVSIDKLQLFKPSAGYGTALVKVPTYGSSSPSYLRIPQKSAQWVSLKSSPESFAKILRRLKSASPLAGEHLSTGAKVDLAYKVIESGFFLLGTPWFSSISSKSLLRLDSDVKRRHSFVLGIQTLELNDLLFNDPGALTESSQLFRIGVLLMEIALETPDPGLRSETSHDADRSKNLPLVEEKMGAQYCKATAFCLQYRQPYKRFRGLEKYSEENFDEWKAYLAEFLEEYHSQVFLRLQTLREVDGDSQIPKDEGNDK